MKRLVERYVGTVGGLRDYLENLKREYEFLTYDKLREEAEQAQRSDMEELERDNYFDR